MNDLYSAAYFIGHAYGDDPKRKAMKRQEAGRIYERIRSEGAVLDVGCGIGDFMSDHFSNWNKVGVDVSVYARAACGDKRIDCYADIDEVRGEFDLVVFRGSFQHLDEPMRALKRSYELLKPGGLLALLATPNSNSPMYRRLKTLPALDAPRNFVIPSDIMLVNILRNLGFDGTEVVYPYLGTPYARPLVDMLNFVIGRKSAFPKSMMEVYAWKPR